jgi:hypothetical protein
MQKVAEEVCVSLVAPNDWAHPGWRSILPSPATEVRANILFLAQRLLGLPSARIPADVVSDLVELTNETAETEGGRVREDSYVPACVALSTDAEALLL